MIIDIADVMKALDINLPGRYEKKSYIMQLKDSDEYGKMYTKLGDNATNIEFPDFGTNTNDTTIEVTNYFEISVNNVDYVIELTADFENDNYFIKIGEK